MKPLDGARIGIWKGAPGELAATGEALNELGAWVLPLNSFIKLRQQIEKHSLDVVLVTCAHARELLVWLRDFRQLWEGKSVPLVIALGGTFDVGLYLEAMALGAFDAVGLPVEQTELVRLVQKAMEMSELSLTA